MRWILASLIKFLFGLTREREPTVILTAGTIMVIHHPGARTELISPKEARRRGYEEEAAQAERMLRDRQERGPGTEGEA